MSSAVRSLAVVPLLLLLAGCDAGDVFDPDDLPGTYALVLFNGDPLPAVAETESDPCEVLTMKSGSLTLDEGGTFSLAQSFDFVGSCGAAAQSYEFTLEGSYATSGTSISLDLPEDSWWDFEGTVATGRVTVSPLIPADDDDSERLKSYTFER